MRLLLKAGEMSVEAFIDILYNSLFWISLLTFILIVGYIIYRELVKK
ncbi:MAG: hypothetical protein QW655_04660 [Nitrososphaerota archaeon]